MRSSLVPENRDCSTGSKEASDDRLSALVGQHRSALLVRAGLLALFVAACAALSPAEVNGDGLGYLRRLEGDALAPGHLGYLPLGRALVRVLAPSPHERALFDLEPILRWLSIILATATLILFHGAARRLLSARQALFATALLALCHGFFRSAREVEVYASSLFFLVAALHALVRLRSTSRHLLWSTVAGLATGAAILFHLTLVLVAPGTLFMIARFVPAGARRRALLVAGTALSLSCLVPLLLALHSVGATAPAAAWHWLREADHGLPYHTSLLNPLTALWGIGRSLVYAPYPHEASLVTVASLSALGFAAWAALLLLRRRAPRLRDGEPSPIRNLVFWWLPPLALFGVLFYPSDTERWLFALPIVALWLAPVTGRAAVGVLAAVALTNLVSVDLPGAFHRTGRERALAVDRSLRPDDLVVSPGNGWDEMLGFSVKAPARRFILIYWVGAERSLARAVERMHGVIERRLAAGGRAFVARLEDAEDRRGFKELAWFGMQPDRFAALFARYRPRRSAIRGLWELSPVSRR
jgi:hypothetical protein